MEMKIKNYQVYQVKGGAEYRDVRFTSIKEMELCGLKIEKVNYDQTQNGSVQYKTLRDGLEQIFVNYNHPDAVYSGRSLSVGDVVKIQNRYFYCDSMGFKYIKGF